MTGKTSSAIRPLPDEVAAQIKSSTTISSLEHVIVGLVQNALDAGSRRIEVSVDYGRGACIVEDDGLGIDPREFLEAGGLGKPFHTSKCDGSGNLHGEDGTFLASLATMSLLTITSHHHAHRILSTLVFHHKRPAARLIPAPSHHQLLNREHGTKVEVHDLFGNIPVRVKQRGLSLSNDKERTREWESISRTLIGLLLAWHFPVNTILADQGAKRKITLSCRNAGSDGATTDFQFSKSLDLSWICSLLSQAGYIEPADRATWVKASARTPFITIRGAFSLQPVPTRKAQFISLGVRHLNANSGTNVLYDEVNRLFAVSNFGNLEDLSDNEIAEERKGKDKRYKKDGYTNKQLRGGGKGVDRWPMFVIRIEIQGQMSGLVGSRDALEQESTLSNVLEVLGAMITGFLSAHHFRPRKQRRRRRSKSPKHTDSSPSMTASTQYVSRTSKSNGTMVFSPEALDNNIRFPLIQANRSQHLCEGFHTWSRIKSGSARGVEDGFLINGTQPSTSGQSKGPPGRGLREEIQPRHTQTNSPSPGAPVQTIKCGPAQGTVPDTDSESTNKEFEPNLAAEDTITWTNPVTKASLLVNARTGQVIPPSKASSMAAATGKSCHDGALFDMKAKVNSDKLSRLALTPAVPKAGSWVSNFLKGWDNPVFSPTAEPTISQASFEGPTLETPGNLHGRAQTRSHLDVEQALSASSSVMAAKLSKSSLKTATIVSQVDKKFILVLVDPSMDNPGESWKVSNERRLLVLIDQHAADERIRVEALLADLCAEPSLETSHITTSLNQKPAIATILLSKPLRFQIKSQEYRLFTAHAQHFANWGIIYDLVPLTINNKASAVETLSECKIAIKALPPVIAERCRLEPKLLIELLRREIWKRDDEHGRGGVIIPDPHHDEKEGINTEKINWTTRTKTLPQGILDMLNSRACRSAVMFNDELGSEECETLVRRLADCRFPFQCAHGRPSMVPLVAVGGEGGQREGGLDFGAGDADVVIEQGEAFGEAWRRWRGKRRQEGDG
ncbi:MAG: hypothetical protein Q9181_005636 [Wetmoreana brouardii]